MKTGTHFEKAAYAPEDIDIPRSRSGYPGQDLKERAFAGAIFADDADHFTTADVERNFVQGPERFQSVSASVTTKDRSDSSGDLIP